MAKIILDNHKLLGTTPDGFQVGSEKVGTENQQGEPKEEGSDLEKIDWPTGKSDQKK